MDRHEFINALQAALNGNVLPEVVAEEVQYYENYINTELGKGRSEEEVLADLGGPRLIAKSIIDAEEAAGRRIYTDSTYDEPTHTSTQDASPEFGRENTYHSTGSAEYGTEEESSAYGNVRGNTGRSSKVQDAEKGENNALIIGSVGCIIALIVILVIFGLIIGSVLHFTLAYPGVVLVLVIGYILLKRTPRG